MARTESKAIQVHPHDEQEQIDLMQKFHWSLLSSQTIDKVDSHLERRGDSIYSVTSSEKYVKLTFSRDIDLPNLNEIKKLENDYFNLPTPYYPKLFPLPFKILCGAGFFFGVGVGQSALTSMEASVAFGIGIALAIFLLRFFISYNPEKKKADGIAQSNYEKRKQIMSEVEKFN